MRTRGGSPAARQTRLIVGPWIHSTLLPKVSGDVDFGVMSQALALDLEGIMLRSFDHWLKGVEVGMLDEPPVKLFVMGDNRWRDEPAWPLPPARA